MKYYERPEDLPIDIQQQVPSDILNVFYAAYKRAFAEGKTSREGWSLAWQAIEKSSI